MYKTLWAYLRLLEPKKNFSLHYVNRVTNFDYTPNYDLGCYSSMAPHTIVSSFTQILLHS